MVKHSLIESLHIPYVYCSNPIPYYIIKRTCTFLCNNNVIEECTERNLSIECAEKELRVYSSADSVNESISA